MAGTRAVPEARKRRRLSVALMVPGSVADEIDGLRRALGSGEVTRLGPHLTLVAPRNVPDGDVQPACEMVREAAAASAPLALDLGPPASFLPGNPVCYLPVTGKPSEVEALRALAARLAAGALAAPLSRRERPFVPHVTLNQRLDAALIPLALEVLANYETHVVFERATVLEFSEAERRWLPIGDAPLGGRPFVSGRGGFEVQLVVSERLDPDVERWSAAAWDQYSRSQYGEHISAYRPFAITARVGGAIAGIADGEIRGPVCRLAHLLVSPEQRSSGIGTRLLNAAQHLAAEAGCGRLRLETLASGRAAGFYSGRGYSVVAELPRYREDQDFVMMERSLTASG